MMAKMSKNQTITLCNKFISKLMLLQHKHKDSQWQMLEIKKPNTFPPQKDRKKTVGFLSVGFCYPV
jgi:hypothetical protein